MFVQIFRVNKVIIPAFGAARGDFVHLTGDQVVG